MPLICRTCQRLNPAGARYCYQDGRALDDHDGAAPRTPQFSSPFVFPSGRTCPSFETLVRACRDEWEVARTLLRKGTFQSFLGGLGRLDLAEAARKEAGFPDPDRGLDRFLAALPGEEVPAAHLQVEPTEMSLGVLTPGQNRSFELRLINSGGRLLYGSVTCPDALWLVLGGPQGSSEKSFKCLQQEVMEVHVRPDRLRAGFKPLEAHLLIDSNGGTETLIVRAEVPVKAFPSGPLAGAKTPRQVAEKAKANPKEAASLFENGAVAEWYRSNGWVYPVQGQTTTGLAAVQQFFEALGLVKAPKLQVTPGQLELNGAPGDSVPTVVRVESQENRPIYVHASSNVPWVRVQRVGLRGRFAEVSVVIDAPADDGTEQTGTLILVGNGNQQFRIPVKAAASSALQVLTPRPPQVVKPVRPEPVRPEPVRPQPVRPEPVAAALEPEAEASGSGSAWWLHLGTILAMMLVVAILVVLDLRLPNRRADGADPSVAEEVVQLDSEPWLEVQPHDGDKPEWTSQVPPPLRGTFGLHLTSQAGTLAGKRLMYDRWGRTNNVCVRIDRREVLLGDPAAGSWEGAFRSSWLEEGEDRSGMKGTWRLRGQDILVRQMVNIVPGQIQRVNGRLLRHRDTCLVRYWVENRTEREHQVGLRVLLDTYIGANDGVPFVVPGRSQTCSTSQVFATPSEVPEYILALEEDNPENPGTVVNLRFRVPGTGDVPDRVTLGAWPHWLLPQLRGQAKGHRTGWDVPVQSIQAITAVKDRDGNPRQADSGVAIYWNPRPLPPGQVRQVGYACGLGQVAGDAAPSQLRVLGAGKYQLRSAFTVQALLRNPVAGQTVTLELPSSMELVRGTSEQKVPPLAAGTARPENTVTWTVRGIAEGTYNLTVRSSTGVEQRVPVEIQAQVGIFD